ncbi:transcriptional regulator, Crp/Fnr family [Sphingomonas guangdongensis]|uniref:Transcriptional regulator, Crp/Fnr family n=1 Tax=Sphingomonas guangdongensis TaxID=1141890 RepID=A0A285QZZ2_9SPHN|nr:Crp/Fnr family transcriptional regulator [Sphingomonas guangdongensis]SOB87440.1 transcriptional regulator, Crp/Fnr family [Sphingomonas guangdongensis]
MTESHSLDAFIDKLHLGETLGLADRRAVRSLPFRLRRMERGGFVVREGDRPHRCNILLSGYAFSSKVCSDGARAVLALHMEGDPLDIAGCSGSDAQCNVQALTPIVTADLSRDDLCALAHDHPAIAAALWRLTARNAAMLGEWLTNVGRRSARGRISHLICEIAARQRDLGVSCGADYVMPLTQEQLGDSTGLTSVHVNRVLQGLRGDKLIALAKQRVTIIDWERLRHAGDFRPGYLQLAA